jgi:hypothetical protein
MSITPFGGDQVYVYQPHKFDWYAKSAGKVVFYSDTIALIRNSEAERLLSAFACTGNAPLFVESEVVKVNEQILKAFIQTTDRDREEWEYVYGNRQSSHPSQIKIKHLVSIPGVSSSQGFALQDIELTVSSTDQVNLPDD